MEASLLTIHDEDFSMEYDSVNIISCIILKIIHINKLIFNNLIF